MRPADALSQFQNVVRADTRVNLLAAPQELEAQGAVLVQAGVGVACDQCFASRKAHELSVLEPWSCAACHVRAWQLRHRDVSFSANFDGLP